MEALRKVIYMIYVIKFLRNASNKSLMYYHQKRKDKENKINHSKNEKQNQQIM